MKLGSESLAAIKDKLRDFFDQQGDVSIAILFGSVASGRLSPQSDIDIAVGGKLPFTLDRRVEIANQLSIATGREIDVLDLAQLNGLILREVLTKGIPIKKHDTAQFAALMRRLWYHQADMAPYSDMILKTRRKGFLDG